MYLVHHHEDVNKYHSVLSSLISFSFSIPLFLTLVFHILILFYFQSIHLALNIRLHLNFPVLQSVQFPYFVYIFFPKTYLEFFCFVLSRALFLKFFFCNGDAWLKRHDQQNRISVLSLTCRRLYFHLYYVISLTDIYFS